MKTQTTPNTNPVAPHPLPTPYCLLPTACSFLLPILALSLLTQAAWANSTPILSNVRVNQMADASKRVEILYDLYDPDGDLCTIWVVASSNGGATWRVPIRTLTGDVGPQIASGNNRQIIWDAPVDIPGRAGDFKVRVYADDGNGDIPMVIVPAGSFPYQNGAHVFVPTFLIGKYEMTNLQYCEFLNAADPAGDYWRGNMEIARVVDGEDIHYAVDDGRENYPIRYVSALDAEAYCAWLSTEHGRSYRLPTEQEWEKAAGWDPVEQHHYTYGFHQDTIDQTWCNYANYYGGPTEVGYFNGTNEGTNNARSYYGAYDMSGNLFEWTSSIYSGSSRVIRGGYWSSGEGSSRVVFRSNYFSPSNRLNFIGFRLVLDL